MSKLDARPKTLNVTVAKGKEGLFYGTSAELSGLLVASQTANEVLAEVPQAIADLYHASGFEEVEMIQIDQTRWIARPVVK